MGAADSRTRGPGGSGRQAGGARQERATPERLSSARTARRRQRRRYEGSTDGRGKAGGQGEEEWWRESRRGRRRMREREGEGRAGLIPTEGNPESGERKRVSADRAGVEGQSVDEIGWVGERTGARTPSRLARDEATSPARVEDGGADEGGGRAEGATGGSSRRGEDETSDPPSTGRNEAEETGWGGGGGVEGRARVGIGVGSVAEVVEGGRGRRAPRRAPRERPQRRLPRLHAITGCDRGPILLPRLPGRRALSRETRRCSPCRSRQQRCAESLPPVCTPPSPFDRRQTKDARPRSRRGDALRTGGSWLNGIRQGSGFTSHIEGPFSASLVSFLPGGSWWPRGSWPGGRS